MPRKNKQTATQTPPQGDKGAMSERSTDPRKLAYLRPTKNLYRCYGCGNRRWMFASAFKNESFCPRCGTKLELAEAKSPHESDRPQKPKAKPPQLRTVDCACTRCLTPAKPTKAELKRGVRCQACGGNVVMRREL